MPSVYEVSLSLPSLREGETIGFKDDFSVLSDMALSVLSYVR